MDAQLAIADAEKSFAGVFINPEVASPSGISVVRFVHHALSWAFLIFIPIHVYLSIRADHLERTGVVSSIISGGRFVPTDQKFTDE